jgi:hypothetical protein
MRPLLLRELSGIDLKLFRPGLPRIDGGTRTSARSEIDHRFHRAASRKTVHPRRSQRHGASEFEGEGRKLTYKGRTSKRDTKENSVGQASSR